MVIVSINYNRTLIKAQIPKITPPGDVAGFSDWESPGASK